MGTKYGLSMLGAFLIATLASSLFSTPLAYSQDAAGSAGQGDASAKQMYYEAEKPDAPKKLGLKYKILLQNSEGDLDEVTEKHDFESGDRLRFVFEANCDGYLYIFHKSSGDDAGVRLFPDKRIYSGKNYIKRYSAVTIPPSRGGWWRFDDDPGKESLFVFFSPKPITNLVNLLPADKGDVDSRSWDAISSMATKEEEKMGARQIYYEEPEQNAPPSSGYVVGEGQILVHNIVLRHE